MTRVEQVENQIKELNLDELRAFRNWFAQFDAELWDQQIEADAKDGKLDGLADRAVQYYKAGRSTIL